ncbi:DUF1700 domain-containing protein [Candidatus Pacearchaeota archaeon]|nr:DUF1700 domain-containing protein [Candidatus Pacearchaeota archaeon]
MRKTEFLNELEEHLIGIAKDDKEEIMQDYEEHFKVGAKKKRTEAGIAKSLGNPKQIARDIRKELSKTTERDELKSEAIETFVAAKKFTKHIFNESKNKIENLIQEEKGRNRKGEFSKELWIILGLIVLSIISGRGIFMFGAVVIFVYSAIKYIKKEKKGNSKNAKIKSTSKKAKSNRKSSIKIILSLMFNFLFFIWFWISILCTLISLLISGIAILLSGAIVMAYSIFALISYKTPLTKDILFSALFAGAGLTIFGGLFTGLFEKLTKLFFKITKKYIELNMRFVRKWE